MAELGVDYDLDTFTAKVMTPHGKWTKVRVLVADGAAHVIAPGAGGQPEIVATGRVESTVEAGGRTWIDVGAAGGGTEQWLVDPPCGCASPARRWGRAHLLALAADARARDAV